MAEYDDAHPRPSREPDEPRRQDDMTGGTREDAQGSPSRESVERRAYERFQQRGGEHGRDMDDWLDAERELNENEGDRQSER